MKVLVIENAPAICERLLALLEASGRYEGMGCITCASLALDLVDECRPDALLLDVRLPDGSGLAVLEELRGQRRDIPTILLADTLGWQYRIRAQALGATLLSKTEEFEAILPALDGLLGAAAGARS
jgi:DNA-binding NarL/FixJ family response regulator